MPVGERLQANKMLFDSSVRHCGRLLRRARPPRIVGGYSSKKSMLNTHINALHVFFECVLLACPLLAEPSGRERTVRNRTLEVVVGGWE